MNDLIPRKLDGQQHGGRRAGPGQLRDYTGAPLTRSVQPNPGMIEPAGPANFPISRKRPDGQPLETEAELLRQILTELRAGSTAGRPMMRGRDVNDVGDTLDWSVQGLMDRVMLRNKGPDSLWYAFDVDGPAVDAFTSDLSFELQAQEAITIPRCLFYKVGVICASGDTATIHAIAFMATAGNLGLGII